MPRRDITAPRQGQLRLLLRVWRHQVHRDLRQGGPLQKSWRHPRPGAAACALRPPCASSVLGLGESGLGLPKVDQRDLVLKGQIPRVHAARTGGLGLVQAGVVNEGLVALLRMIPAERVVVDAALKNLKQRCNSAADLVHGGSRVVIRRKLVLDEGEVRSQKLDEASGLLQRSEGLPLVLGELASLLAILGDPTAPVGGEASMLG